MALALSTLRKPVNNQVVDQSTGVMREEWQLFFQQLTKQLNAATGDSTAATYGYFDVRDFGALGDGTTDDTAAFQAAENAADASDSIKRVYVPTPPVAYVIETVTVHEGVTIFGDNRKGLELSRIKPVAAFTGPLFESDDYGNSRKLRIGLEGLFLDGSSTTFTPIALNCQESHLRDLTIKNCFTYGIHIGGISSGATEQALNNHIEDCHLAGQIGSVEFYDGIFLDYFTADTTIVNTYVEACKDAGIRSRGYNNKILNNHIYAVAGTGGGVGVGIYTETSADQDISHNYIELCAASGVLIDGGGSDVATLNAVVSANTFRNIDTGNTASGVVVVQGSDVSSVAIADNTVRRDAATSYATPYFAYFNGITPALARVAGNIWQSGLITTGESNLFRPPVDFLNTSRVLLRKAAGAGMGEEGTLSELLDFIGSAAQGDILFRGASSWERLGAGTEGRFLEAQGAAANLQWLGGPPRLVASGALSGVATIDVTVPANCEILDIDYMQFQPVTDDAVLWIRLSQAGSFLAGASDYAWDIFRGTGTVAANEQDLADSEIHVTGATNGVGNAAGESVSGTIRIWRPAAAAFQKHLKFDMSTITGTGNYRTGIGFGRLLANTDAIDGVRLMFSTGNIAAGYYAVRAYGS